jgi:hypothetical protein
MGILHGCFMCQLIQKKRRVENVVAFWAKGSIVSRLGPATWTAHKACIVSRMPLVVKIYFHLQLYSIVCQGKTWFGLLVTREAGGALGVGECEQF